MKDFWNARTPRERLLLAIAAAAISLFFLLQLVVAPIARWRSAALERAEAAEANYELVALAAGQAITASPTGNVPVRNLLNDAALAAQVPLTFINARPDGGVEMQAGPASPERVYELFAALERRHGVQIESADIAREPADPALVRVQASLKR
jgi:general secretion pathway protein M